MHHCIKICNRMNEYLNRKIRFLGNIVIKKGQFKKTIEHTLLLKK